MRGERMGPNPDLDVDGDEGSDRAAGAGREDEDTCSALPPSHWPPRRAATTPTLTSNTPWWEKITVTYDGNGSHRACNYETSLAYAQTQEACDMGSARAEAAKAAASNAGVQTKITFERRFTPGTPPELDACNRATP